MVYGQVERHTLVPLKLKLLGAEIQEWPTAIPESHLLNWYSYRARQAERSEAIYRYRALLISRFLDFEYTAELALSQSRFQYRVLSISRSHILRFEIRGFLFYFRLAIGELFISAILRSYIFCEISAKNWMQKIAFKNHFYSIGHKPYSAAAFDDFSVFRLRNPKIGVYPGVV